MVELFKFTMIYIRFEYDYIGFKWIKVEANLAVKVFLELCTPAAASSCSRSCYVVPTGPVEQIKRLLLSLFRPGNKSFFLHLSCFKIEIKSLLRIATKTAATC